MTQEYKKLLLKDLCARLPYNVCICFKTRYRCNAITDVLDGAIYTYIETHLLEDDAENEIDIIKPYLRTMSSMTEEEYEQYRKFSYYGAAGYRNNDYKEMIATPSFEKMDFLNAHHFDYRGLIEKGLALEAPEGMYNTK